MLVRRPPRGRAAVVGLLVAAVGVLAAACTPDGEVPPSDHDRPHHAVHLSVAIYGSSSVRTAYRAIADDFGRTHPRITVSVDAYATHAAELAATRTAAASSTEPDLFLMQLGDLPTLLAEHLTQPVDRLLGERHVDFGDGFVRDSLEAFSSNAALQCMPTEMSPLVVYYNTALVDLTKAQGRSGRDITATAGWSMPQFAAAAEQAAQPGARSRRGLYVAPDLQQIAPFVWSAGGQVVNDPQRPTSLALAKPGSVDGITQLLDLLRTPGVSYTAAQLRRHGALAQFEAGHLAMILGYRGLTATLRRHPRLEFDVLPLPNLGTRATSGQFSGVCMSSSAAHPAEAADLLAYLVSDHSMSLLARTGAVMPTNLAVTASDAFLQPGQDPASAVVFTNQARYVLPLPTMSTWSPVAGMAARVLASMMAWSGTQPLLPDRVQDRLARLDAASAPVLAPPTPATPTTPASGSAG